MNAEAAPAKSRRLQFAEEIKTSNVEGTRFLPSQIRADHRRNTGRGGWTPYDPPPELAAYFGDRKICFTMAQIEKRLASLLAEGQLEDLTVSIAGDKRPDLEIGFLRHAAFLLAEVRGVLDQIPGAKGPKFYGVRAKVVPAAKTQEEYDAASDRNFAENSERLGLSPVAFAFYIKRKLDMFNDNGEPLYTRLTLAKKLDIDARVLDRYMQLLKARPETLLAVHEGTLSMAAALKHMSDTGEGGARGKRAGVSHKTMRKALRIADKRPLPTKGLSAEKLRSLLAVLAGEDSITDETDETVAAWVKAMTPTADEIKANTPKVSREPKPSNKLAPPTAQDLTATPDAAVETPA
jgi:hypothetical protein